MPGTRTAGQPERCPPCLDEQRSLASQRSESKPGGSGSGCAQAAEASGCMWDAAAGSPDPAGQMWGCSFPPGSQRQFGVDLKGCVISSENRDVCLLKVMGFFLSLCVCANNF